MLQEKSYQFILNMSTVIKFYVTYIEMLEIIIWDVQHGSAAYVHTPGNKHIVIDLGTGSHIGDAG